MAMSFNPNNPKVFYKNCEWCGRKFLTHPTYESTKTCSKNCASSLRWSDPQKKLARIQSISSGATGTWKREDPIRRRKASENLKKQFRRHSSSKMVNPEHSLQGEIELLFCLICDALPEVASYEKLKVRAGRIRYWSVRQEKFKLYTPDFWVNLTDGRRLLVEVKGKRFRDDVMKQQALLDWCPERGIIPLWIEEHILRDWASEMGIHSTKGEV